MSIKLNKYGVIKRTVPKHVGHAKRTCNTLYIEFIPFTFVNGYNYIKKYLIPKSKNTTKLNIKNISNKYFFEKQISLI